MTDHRRHVVRVETNHFAHQYTGQVGNVVVRPVDYHGHAACNSAVEAGNAPRLRLGQQALAVGAGGFAQQLVNGATVGRQLAAGVGQVPGNGGFIAGGAGDQRIERGAPGVHGVGGQGDFFGNDVRLVGHGGVPRSVVSVVVGG